MVSTAIAVTITHASPPRLSQQENKNLRHKLPEHNSAKNYRLTWPGAGLSAPRGAAARRPAAGPVPPSRCNLEAQGFIASKHAGSGARVEKHGHSELLVEAHDSHTAWMGPGTRCWLGFGEHHLLLPSRPPQARGSSVQHTILTSAVRGKLAAFSSPVLVLNKCSFYSNEDNFGHCCYILFKALSLVLCPGKWAAT